jgi:hypothetical protein
MARVKSVPLIERRAQAEALAQQEKAHRAECARGNSCKELQEIRAELKQARDDLKGWFASGDDQESLF